LAPGTEPLDHRRFGLVGWHQMNRKQRQDMARKIQAEDLSLEVAHPHAAGIDIGNESHYAESKGARRPIAWAR